MRHSWHIFIVTLCLSASITTQTAQLEPKDCFITLDITAPGKQRTYYQIIEPLTKHPNLLEQIFSDYATLKTDTIVELFAGYVTGPNIHKTVEIGEYIEQALKDNPYTYDQDILNAAQIKAAISYDDKKKSTCRLFQLIGKNDDPQCRIGKNCTPLTEEFLHDANCIQKATHIIVPKNCIGLLHTLPAQELKGKKPLERLQTLNNHTLKLCTKALKTQQVPAMIIDQEKFAQYVAQCAAARK